MNAEIQTATTLPSPILKLDVAGLPVEWIGWQTAATLYARDCVRWEVGDVSWTLQGGRRADGLRSTLTINSIIAVADRGHRYQRRRPPPLTNRTLFQRDGHVCLYCGERFAPRALTRDHVIPLSKGGADCWTNVATACRPCNAAKGNRLPEQWRPLIAVPFVPDPASYLLLVASGRIRADQQAWLESYSDRRRPLS